MNEMSIDLETYSDVDISKCGAYKYAESDHFEILLFGVSVDNGPVVVMTLLQVMKYQQKSWKHYLMRI